MAREGPRVNRSRVSAVSVHGTAVMIRARPALWLRWPPLSQAKRAAEGGKRKITALRADTNLMVRAAFISDDFSINHSSVLLVFFQRVSSSQSQKCVFFFFLFIHLDSFG